MRIVQVVPEVVVGRGVEAVAFHLEREWRRAGVETARFTLADAAGAWLPSPGTGLTGKAVLALRVVWFSTFGSWLAGRDLRLRGADTIVICHNDALAGDVYVNHGIVLEAMRARGRVVFRMLRNPMHAFTWVRDAVRYAGRTHVVIVNLTTREDELLRHTYPRITPRTVVIPNGVDIARYQPETPVARAAARAELSIPESATVALFVGHEFERKGLPTALQALQELPEDVHLLVVGGTDDMVAVAKKEARQLGLGIRVTFTGAQQDSRPFFHASDFLIFPSMYESYGLVVLEALACGLPVVATAVGCVPDVIQDGVNGFIVENSARSVAAGVRALCSADRDALRVQARLSAEKHSWTQVAERYLGLFQEILKSRGTAR